MPGFEPGTSATRTQRSTGLSHTPDYSGNNNTDGVGFEPTRTMSTRFPIVRLKPLGHPSKRGSGVARTTVQRREWDPRCFAPLTRGSPWGVLAIATRPLESNPRAVLTSRVLEESNASVRSAELIQGTVTVRYNGGSGIRTHAVQAPTP